MRTLYRKSLGAYIRLLRLFEAHLKEYHKLFDNEYYKIHYIVQRERFTNDAHIKVIFTILRAPFWKLMIGEKDNIKIILENYCRYFSVTDITIVRALNLKNKDKDISSSLYQYQPIEERVTFDIFMYETEWLQITIEND